MKDMNDARVTTLFERLRAECEQARRDGYPSYEVVQAIMELLNCVITACTPDRTARNEMLENVCAALLDDPIPEDLPRSRNDA
jgi:hypothetical protein